MLQQYTLPCGIETSRPRYLACVLFQCIGPGVQPRAVELEWLIGRAAELGLALTRVDAEWMCAVHARMDQDRARRAEEPAS